MQATDDAPVDKLKTELWSTVESDWNPDGAFQNVRPVASARQHHLRISDYPGGFFDSSERHSRQCGSR
uniref:Uncharacterized protein n=1 Tax=Steinernema glaseri TaxID=37863 RepID=A0A1I7YWU7_9BILA